MSNFLTRAKALAYDIDQLMIDIRLLRSDLSSEELHSSQENEAWYQSDDDFRESHDEPEVITHTGRLKDLLNSYEALKLASVQIEHVIVNETLTDDVELPEFLPFQTGGQG